MGFSSVVWSAFGVPPVRWRILVFDGNSGYMRRLMLGLHAGTWLRVTVLI